jgi:phage-related holin
MTLKGISILNNESSLGMAQKQVVKKLWNVLKKSGDFIMAYM